MEESIDRLELRISESAAGRMCGRMIAGSDFRTRQQYEYNALGFSQIKASLELRSSRLRFLRLDHGAVRLDVSVRSEFSFGFAYPDRRIDLSCAVLVRPELRRNAEGLLVIAADFSEAALEDLHVKRKTRGGMLGFDSSTLDPFADDRMREFARLALRAALKRIGEVEGVLRSTVVTQLLDAADAETQIRVEVGDGEIRATAGMNGAQTKSEIPATAGDRDGLLRLSDALLTRLFEELANERSWSKRLRIESSSVRCRAGGIDVDAEFVPTNNRWPKRWRPRFEVRLEVVLQDSRVGLRVLRVSRGALLRRPWIQRWALKTIAARVSEQSWPLSVVLPIPQTTDDEWTLEVDAIDADAGALDVTLKTDL